MPRPTAPDEPLFSGPLLVVEDSGIIAIEVKRIARSLGASHVHLATTVEAAIALVEAESLQAAILDFGLHDDTSAAVADALDARGVPYVFASGYAGTDGIDPRFRSHPMVAKPVSPAALRKVFAPLL